MKKVALVTGSSRGIGKQIAKELLANNYIVYLNSRNLKELKQLKIEFSNENAKYINADLTDDLNIKKALDDIESSEKRLDLVIANIGSGKSISGWDVDIEEYKKVFDINFFSSVSLATNSIKVMKKNTKGHIIFISSIAGCESLGAPITYSAAKTALLSFSKNLSNDVAKFNIRVNSISPGNVMFEGSTWDDKMKINRNNVEDYIQNNVPLNTFVSPSEIAKSVIYLEESNSSTGTNLIVDGGQLNQII